MFVIDFDFRNPETKVRVCYVCIVLSNSMGANVCIYRAEGERAWSQQVQVHHFQWFLGLRLAAKRINLDIDSCGILLGYTE